MKPLSTFSIKFAMILGIVTLLIPITSAHMILRTEGIVSLKRKGQREFQPTGAGERLRRGDEIKKEPERRVIVFCDEVNVWEIEKGVIGAVSAGCPRPGKRILRGRGVSDDQPGGSDPQVPFALSPRMTYLLNDRPTLRWNAVKSASRYDVGILGPAGFIWQKAVNTTKADYPQDAPQFESGTKYLLSIKADNGASSSQDAGSCLGFELLKKEKAAEIRLEVKRIRGFAQLTPEENALALAYFYGNAGLIGDAIENLEPLVKNGTKNPLVYRELAGLYARAGLNLLARKHYMEALEISKASHDDYGLAKTKAKLAGVEQMLEQKRRDAHPCYQIITPRE